MFYSMNGLPLGSWFPDRPDEARARLIGPNDLGDWRTLNISGEDLRNSELQESAAFGADAVDVTGAEPRERLNAQEGFIPVLVIFQTACQWPSTSSVPEATPFPVAAEPGRRDWAAAAPARAVAGRLPRRPATSDRDEASPGLLT
jgi:hypothetical protein